MDEWKGKDLRGLDRPELRAIYRATHVPMLDQFDGIFDGHGGDGCLVLQDCL